VLRDEHLVPRRQLQDRRRELDALVPMTSKPASSASRAESSISFRSAIVRHVLGRPIPSLIVALFSWVDAAAVELEHFRGPSVVRAVVDHHAAPSWAWRYSS
jgi:hypothetical protein